MSRVRASRRSRAVLDGELTPRDERRFVVLGLVVLAVTAAVAVLSTVAIDGGPLSSPYRVEVRTPAGAPALKDGDEVRIAGQRAGEVREVRPGRDGGAVLALDLDDGPVGRDASADVRLRGLAGAVTVDVDPGDARDPLPSGAQLDAPATAGTALTDVVEAFDPPARKAAHRALRGFGSGLAGRGDDLGAAIDDLGPLSRDARPLAAAMRPEPGVLAGLTKDLGTTAAAFGDGPLDGAVTGARRTLDALAPADVRRLLRALPPAQAAVDRVAPQARALLADAGSAAAELRPAVARLDTALPPLRRALDRAPALDELARTGRAARPVLLAARPLARDLDDPANLLAPLTNPLDELAAHLAPYREELVLAPKGFTTWGGFAFAEGQAKGARAVRFSMVLSCARARDPYPQPGGALKQAERCP
ncbi:MlaD family protein [Conexibacter sp. SYSU D00693]|uniref:MlaD family protein n=1 Tax=Conexibacter sp. SYSU D00693 TaxID=2812560 RepID=UPI00196AF2E4|nr:MlaD family protein [Conexibacter sp. SYSU D00693]